MVSSFRFSEKAKDSQERGLVVENTYRHIDHVWIDGDVHARANDFFLPATLPFTRPDAYTNTRYLTARQGVERVRERITVADFIDVSRNTSGSPQRICRDHTLSGFTAVTDRGRRDLLSMAWVALGHPNNALYVPFFVGAEGVPAFVMDGTLWELSARLHDENPIGRHRALDFASFENDIASKIEPLRTEAARLNTAGKATEAATLLAEASANWARHAASQLGLAAGSVVHAAG